MRRSPRWRPYVLRLKSLYRASDVEGLTHLDSLPGELPFVRGPHAGMYTEKPWTIRQYTGFADATQTNQRLRQGLAEGGQGLSLAFDLATHRGYDSTDPQAHADVGRAGVAIDSVEDMHELLAGIDLRRVSVSMTMSGAVLPVLAAFIVAAEENGVPNSELRGTIQNDILKEFMVRNTWIFAPGPSLRIVTDVIEHLARELPQFNPISVSGYHFQEAGGDAVLELALTLANARTYIEQVQARGLDVEAFCRRMTFFFGVGSDFYVEIAKLRAARLLWSEITGQLGIQSEQGRALRMHCQTSGWTLSAQGAQNNIVRTTLQAMAAVFGGTQSLHTNAWDEALCLPGEEASRLARNTQQILQLESGLCDVIDPWAGSWMMESLTAKLVSEARRTIESIDAQGGVLAALAAGWISKRIHIGALETQARIDSGEQPVLGVNVLPQADHELSRPSCQRDSQSLRTRQSLRLMRLRADRDRARVAAALEAISACARSGEGNLLAATIEAIRARATVGECTKALERVWPRYQQPPSFAGGLYGHVRRDERWQSLCQRLAAWRARHGRYPRLLLAKLGQDGHDRGVRVLAAAMSDAGFAVHLGPLFQSPQELVAQLVDQPVDLLGISTLAGAHSELLPELLRGLGRHGIRVPVVTGGVIPAYDVACLRVAGVAAHFGPGSDITAIGESLLALLPDVRR